MRYRLILQKLISSSAFHKVAGFSIGAITEVLVSILVPGSHLLLELLVSILVGILSGINYSRNIRVVAV